MLSKMKQMIKRYMRYAGGLGIYFLYIQIVKTQYFVSITKLKNLLSIDGIALIH